MRPLERVPAVRRLETDRSDVFAMEVAGEFTSADAENLCGLLQGEFSLIDRIDLLIRLTGVESTDLSDLSEQTVETMRSLVNDHVVRCAVIGETSRAARVERLFSAGTKAELRHFTDRENDEAWAWIGAVERS
jgi:hypothetical protein